MKVELNITLDCNLSCSHCDRMCNIFKDRKEHMTVEQIKKFIGQIGLRTVERIKIVGGEPLLHPDLTEIYMLMMKTFIPNKKTKRVKVETNGTLPIPNVPQTEKVSFTGVEQSEKKHLPYLWHPKDLGYEVGAKPRCHHLIRCGTSLDKYGYLPCSSSIMITRLFGLTDLYKHYLPREPWGLDKICQHCIFAMPRRWKKEHEKYLKDFTEEEKRPTNRYAEAIEKFNHDDFYRTHKEF